MTVHFDAKPIFGNNEVQQGLKEYYERFIAVLAEHILAPEFLSKVEAICIPEDFISAVVEWQKEHGMDSPSVTDNQFGRAYGKMMYDAVAEKYAVFIDASIASWIMDDSVFEICFSQGDEEVYSDAKQRRARAQNMLAHELSHVELAIRMTCPEFTESLYSILLQQSFILFDEYFACRRAAEVVSAPITSDNEKFIHDLECHIDDARCAYKTGKMNFSDFCGLFHSYTEMALIRLVSAIGTNHGMNSGQLLFPATRIGRYAHLLSEEFNGFYNSQLSGDHVNVLDKVADVIHSYFIDMGVQIEDAEKGLRYHVLD